MTTYKINVSFEVHSMERAELFADYLYAALGLHGIDAEVHVRMLDD